MRMGNVFRSSGPQVKICGLTRVEDARFAARAGASYLGAVLVPASPRCVSPERARALASTVRLPLVVVVADLAVREAARVADEAGAAVIQLHGSEPAAVVEALRGRGSWELWKAVRVREREDILRAADHYGGLVDLLLLDAWSERGLGGTGVSFPWELWDPSREGVAGGLRIGVAGGLSPENVEEAVQQLAPDLVDVVSGVELRPGVKDPGRVEAFIRRAFAPELEAGGERTRRERRDEGTMTPTAETKPEAGPTRAGGLARRFGEFGGRYVPETLIRALDELEVEYARALGDSAFEAELSALLRHFVGRPTPLYRAERLEQAAGWGPIYLKREDLNHTGAHKINNTIGQVLLARRMGKERIIAETGAGQHGVATATACALFDMECVVYMGAEDVERQALNVFRMELLGAEVRTVDSGTKTLKDATNEAIRDWVTSVETTHYIIGSVVGPAPFPRIVRDFQAVIGREARAQLEALEGVLPSAVIACVGGGSNAMGIFHAFVGDPEVRLIGVEAAGEGLVSGHHSASLAAGRPGILHGSLSYLLQDEDGQVAPAHSVSAGLDYPGVGPEHSFLRDTGRAEYVSVEDGAALGAFHRLSELEGVIPALETAHAVAYILGEGRASVGRGPAILCLSGRGDKDVAHVARVEGWGSVA